jgi:hypothetical protein
MQSADELPRTWRPRRRLTRASSASRSSPSGLPSCSRGLRVSARTRAACPRTGRSHCSHTKVAGSPARGVAWSCSTASLTSQRSKSADGSTKRLFRLFLHDDLTRRRSVSSRAVSSGLDPRAPVPAGLFRHRDRRPGRLQAVCGAPSPAADPATRGPPVGRSGSYLAAPMPSTRPRSRSRPSRIVKG